MEVDIITKDDFKLLLSKIDELAKAVSQQIDLPAMKYYTNEDVCRLLRVSRRTLQGYRDKGIIEFVQCGRKIYYTQQDISAFMEDNNQKHSK